MYIYTHVFYLCKVCFIFNFQINNELMNLAKGVSSDVQVVVSVHISVTTARRRLGSLRFKSARSALHRL